MLEETKNVTDGLRRYMDQMSENRDKRVSTFVHPLYVELQKDSPMGMMKDFNLSEIDSRTQDMNVHDFYLDYVTHSLPLVFRNGCENWKLHKLIQEDTDKYLKKLFNNDMFGIEQGTNILWTRLKETKDKKYI